jgi:hypothetical protein
MHTQDRLGQGRTEGVIAVAGILVALFAAGVTAQPASPHHQFLGGPWEVLVKMGLEGAGIRMPLSIADENKSQDLRASAPVMGTPIKVKLERYLPDLKWDTAAIDDPNGGPVAKLSLRGENLQQEIWLCARDRERQSVSAHIGSVAMRELPSQAGVQIPQELTEPDVVGVLLVWLSETSAPLVYTAKPGKTVALPGSGWKVSVLRYVPHYSIDKQTKQVTSLSDKPENPAVEIRVEGDKQEYRQWLWSQFFSSPHQKQELPFRIRFVDFHPSGAGGYILIARPGSPPCLLHLQDGKKRIEQVELGQRYPFDDKRYSFAVDEVRPGARIKMTWKNGSDMLLHPAVVATISQGESAQQVVLELGQPCHQKTMVGTLVVLYRRVPQ